MPTEKCNSDTIDLSIAIGEIGKFPDTNSVSEEIEGELRQLCGIVIYHTDTEIGVRIYSSTGATSHSVLRQISSSKIHIEAYCPAGVDSKH
jgi:hypothetical protein